MRKMRAEGSAVCMGRLKACAAASRVLIVPFHLCSLFSKDLLSLRSIAIRNAQTQITGRTPNADKGQLPTLSTTENPASCSQTCLASPASSAPGRTDTLMPVQNSKKKPKNCLVWKKGRVKKSSEARVR